MLIFGSDSKIRGCYSELVYNTSAGRGAYITINGTTLGGSEAPYFISGVSIAQKERYFMLPCFRDKSFLYAFGNNPNASILEVAFTVFLVNPNGTSIGQGLNDLLAAYSSGRVSQAPKKAVLTVGQASASGYVVGMSSATADPAHNIQSFNLIMASTQVQGQIT